MFSARDEPLGGPPDARLSRRAARAEPPHAPATLGLAAGVLAAVIADAAANGSIGVWSVVLFAIVFLVSIAYLAALFSAMLVSLLLR